MAEQAAPPALTQAMPECVEFLVKSRRDWGYQAVWDALAACLAAGWSWPRVVSVAWSTACIAGSAPEDISSAAVALPGQRGVRRG